MRLMFAILLLMCFCFPVMADNSKTCLCFETGICECSYCSCGEVGAKDSRPPRQHAGYTWHWSSTAKRWEPQGLGWYWCSECNHWCRWHQAAQPVVYQQPYQVQQQHYAQQNYQPAMYGGSFQGGGSSMSGCAGGNCGSGGRRR